MSPLWIGESLRVPNVKNGYTYVWEFEVAPAQIEEFERQYGADGAWACLFRRSPDYVETLLLQDSEVTGRYLSVDRWRSKAAYLAFKSEFAAEYAKLDCECEVLTLAERALGAFREL